MSDLIERIAKTCHEVNRLYCISLGDLTQVSWDKAPEWQRKSARSGVIFHMTNRNAGPAASHENWLRDKQADGWVYGPEKDTKKKTHPCCVPYDQLPPEQRMKDMLFITVVRGFIE